MPKDDAARRSFHYYTGSTMEGVNGLVLIQSCIPVKGNSFENSVEISKIKLSNEVYISILH